MTYTIETSKPYTWTADGQNWNAIESSQLNKITVFADGQLAAYFEIVAAESLKSLSGDYPVSGEIRDASGAVTKGYYVDLSLYGMGVMEGGSYLMNGTEKEYLSAGEIAIVDNAGVLAFTAPGLEILDKTSPVGGSLPGTKSIRYTKVKLQQ
jgi:hypothetical protein